MMNNSTDTYLILINSFLVMVTIFAALLQYRVSHAPLIRVIKRRHKLSEKNGAYYEITIENSGNVSSLDGFLIIKEVRKKRKVNGRRIRNNYHLSKPFRIVDVGEKIKLNIKSDMPKDYKKVLFAVVYMDHFGRKYLASDVMNGEIFTREKGKKANGHLERFSKKTIPLSWWKFKSMKYYNWKRKAIKNRNTMAGFVERIELKEDREDQKNLREMVDKFNELH